MRIAVVGASGYTGLEALRILCRHPECEIAAVTSEQKAGQPLGEAFPALRGVVGSMIIDEVLTVGRARVCDKNFHLSPFGEVPTCPPSGNLALRCPGDLPRQKP